MQLVRYRRGFRPTRAERQEIDEFYEALFPELVPIFTRLRLIRRAERQRAPAVHGGQEPQQHRGAQRV